MTIHDKLHSTIIQACRILEKWNTKPGMRYDSIVALMFSFPCLLISFSLVHRRWVRLERKGKGTTWMSGQFNVGDQCGGARRPCASVTKPPMHSCQWQGSSMDGRFTARGRFMPCQAPASTTCGRPWKASLWNPLRAWWATETSVIHTQSSDLSFSAPVSSQHSPCKPLYPSLQSSHYICTSSP